MEKRSLAQPAFADLVLPVTGREARRLQREAAALGVDLRTYVRSALGLPLETNGQRIVADRALVAAAMAVVGRVHGHRGGYARATALSATRRSAIARQAAQARWGKAQP